MKNFRRNKKDKSKIADGMFSLRNRFDISIPDHLQSNLQTM